MAGWAIWVMGSPDYLSRLHRLSAMAALFVVVVGLAVLCGWWWDIPLLYRIRTDLPLVEPTSAVAFVLTGLALLLLRPVRVNRW